MADDPSTPDPASERSEVEAKLELPSLSLRRRRRAKPSDPEPVEAVDDVPPAADADAEPVAVAEPEPAVEAEAPAPVRKPAATTKPAAKRAPAKKTAATRAPAKRTTPIKRAAAMAAPEPAAAPTAAPPEPDVAPSAATELDVAPEPDVAAAVTAEPDVAPAAPRRSLPSIHLPGHVAAVLTGAVVGLTGVLAVYLAEQACSAIRNTTSCGGVGAIVLVAVFALMVLEGAALLKAFGATDQLSTAFLGVGLVAVVTMVFLLGVADRWYMAVVIPLVSAACFVASWWVTSHFSNDEPIQREPYLDL